MQSCAYYNSKVYPIIYLTCKNKPRIHKGFCKKKKRNKSNNFFLVLRFIIKTTGLMFRAVKGHGQTNEMEYRKEELDVHTETGNHRFFCTETHLE